MGCQFAFTISHVTGQVRSDTNLGFKMPVFPQAIIPISGIRAGVISTSLEPSSNSNYTQRDRIVPGSVCRNQQIPSNSLASYPIATQVPFGRL